MVVVYFHPLLGALLIVLAFISFYRPVYAVSLLFLFLPIDLVRPILSGIYVSFSEFELAVVTFSWCLGATFRKEKICLAPIPWILPYLGVVFFSGLINRGLTEAVAHTIRNSELMVGLILAVNVFAGEKNCPRARFAIGSAAVLYSFVGFFQVSSETRVSSFFHNPNQFGAYINILLPFCWSIALTAKNRKTRLSYLFITFILVIAQFLTFSRGSLLSMSMILIVVFLVQFNRFKKVVGLGGDFPFWKYIKIVSAHLILLCFLFPALALLIPHLRPINRMANFSQRIRSVFESRGLEDRTMAFEVGTNLWLSSPIIGLGPGNYHRAITKYVEDAPDWLRIHTHNQYLQLAIDFGLLGLVTAIYLFARLTGWLMKSFLRGSSYSSLRDVEVGGLGLIVGLFIHGLVDEILSNHAMEIGLLLGMALAGMAMIDVKTSLFNKYKSFFSSEI